MVLLYGRAGRLTARTVGLRPGQSTKRWDELNSEIASLKKQLAAAQGPYFTIGNGYSVTISYYKNLDNKLNKKPIKLKVPRRGP